jgi:MoaA/NifB/PqqE/SkfB family radical SAM enzyme
MTNKNKSHYMEASTLLRPDIPGKFNELDALEKQWLRYIGGIQGNILPPYEVLIHPSSSCNLRCAWCIGEHVPSNGNDLIYGPTREGMNLPNTLADPTLMIKLLESIATYKKKAKIETSNGIVEREFGVEAISFSGLIGEPLSSKASVLAAVNYLSKAGIRSGLFTNATLLDDRAAEVLLLADYVLVSLDAANAVTYSKIKFGGKAHGIPLFQRAIDNTRNLISKKINSKSSVEVNCSFILYPENYQEVYSAAALAKDLGISCFRIKQDNSGTRPLSENQVIEVRSLIDAVIRDLASESFKIVCIHKEFTKSETMRKFSKCQITDLMAAIGSDGYLYPCNYHPRPGGLSYGDAVTHGFPEIWEGQSRKSCRSMLPTACPPSCDPFKNRANSILKPISEAYEAGGVTFATDLMHQLRDFR